MIGIVALALVLQSSLTSFADATDDAIVVYWFKVLDGQYKSLKYSDLNEAKSNNRVAWTEAIKRSSYKDALSLLLENRGHLKKMEGYFLNYITNAKMPEGKGDADNFKSNVDGLSLVGCMGFENELLIGFAYKAVGEKAKAAQSFRKVLDGTTSTKKKHEFSQHYQYLAMYAKQQLKAMGY